VTFEGKTYSARQTVDLTSADADVTLQFAPPVDLAGHLTLEGPGVGAVSGHSVYLVSGDRVSRASNELRAQVGADGAFVLKNVPPGLWDIGIDPLPKGGFYKLMQLGDADVLRKEMIIDSESKGPLNIVVSSAGAELSGEVEGGAATAVLAVPIGVNEHVFTFDVVTDVDEQGAFRFHGLMPGAYRIFAFEDLVPWSWMNEKFASRIEGLGTAVELPEGGRASIKVQVIRGTTGEM